MSPLRPVPLLVRVFVLLTAVVGPPSAWAQDWPVFYDPLTVRTINLTLSSADWNTVQNDTTFEQEVPAYLSFTGETPLLVALRRKSSTSLSGPGGTHKVGLKIDVNEFVPGQSWHRLKKLSLENGADTSVLLEGFAWYLHKLAWIPGGYPYMPGFASWVRLNVNGVYHGTYVNVEQVDKRFMENRGLWLDDDTWLYKQSDVGPPTLEFGGPAGSPTFAALCYSPFSSGCATPPPATLATDVANRVDMQGMLTLGAVNAWAYSPDNLFSKGKNIFFADSEYEKRKYYSWDMDANFGSLNATKSIYEIGNSPYEDLILDNTAFRPTYDQIMRTLINGPFKTTTLVPLINQLQTAILPALSADPFNPCSVGDFDALRSFVSARNTNVASQLPAGVAVGDPIPTAGAMLSIGPNPIRTHSRVQFEVERAGRVRVAVYDTRGASVSTLVDGELPVGRHQASWDGTDTEGRRLAAGLYFVSLANGGKRWTKEVVLLR